MCDHFLADFLISFLRKQLMIHVSLQAENVVTFNSASSFLDESFRTFTIFTLKAHQLNSSTCTAT